MVQLCEPCWEIQDEQARALFAKHESSSPQEWVNGNCVDEDSDSESIILDGAQSDAETDVDAEDELDFDEDAADSDSGAIW